MNAECYEGRFGFGYIINLAFPRSELSSERRAEYGAFLREHKVMHVARGTWYVHTRMAFSELQATLTPLLRDGESIFIIPIPDGGLTAFFLQIPKPVTDPKHLEYIERFRKMTPEERIDGRLDDPPENEKEA